MKKILIATDFSPAAENATQYGMRLAEAFGAGVVLSSAYEEMPVPVIGVPNFIEVEDLQDYAFRQLEQEKSRYPGVSSIETVSLGGSPTPALLRAAATVHADLIVTGMKGSHRNIRKIFGSTVTALARKTTLPLLVIPEGAGFAPPRAIGMAVDVIHETDFSIPVAVREIADEFHAKLFVIRMYNKQAGEVIEILHQSVGSSRTIGAFSPIYEFPATDTVAHVLKNYMDSGPIDMLVMRPHPKTLPERWFLHSETRQMIFEAGLPLLILPAHSPKNEPS